LLAHTHLPKTSSTSPELDQCATAALASALSTLLTIAHSQAQADVADKAAVRDLQLSLSPIKPAAGK